MAFGKLKDYQVKVYVNDNVKHVAVQYHLKSRYDKEIQEMRQL